MISNVNDLYIQNILYVATVSSRPPPSDPDSFVAPVGGGTNDSGLYDLGRRLFSQNRRKCFQTPRHRDEEIERRQPDGYKPEPLVLMWSTRHFLISIQFFFFLNKDRRT